MYDKANHALDLRVEASINMPIVADKVALSTQWIATGMLDAFTLGSRTFRSECEFTHRGDARVQETGPHHDAAGINTNLLTTEGDVSVEALFSWYRLRAGRQSQQVQLDNSAMESRSFEDSQVSLLYNMARTAFAMSLLVGEDGEPADIKLPELKYDDGHVSYKIEYAKQVKWPQYSDLQNASSSSRRQLQRIDLHTGVPQDSTDAISLAGLDEKSVALVIGHLGELKNWAGLRLTHSSSSLVSGRIIAYAGQPVPNWINEGPDEEDTEEETKLMTTHITPRDVLTALKSYVAQNRLYEQLREALKMVQSLAFAALPSTIEGHYAYDNLPGVAMPAFRASRGFYRIFLEGQGAITSVGDYNDGKRFTIRPTSSVIPSMLIAHQVLVGRSWVTLSSHLNEEKLWPDALLLTAIKPGQSTSAWCAVATGTGPEIQRGLYGVVHDNLTGGDLAIPVNILDGGAYDGYDLTDNKDGTGTVNVKHASLAQPLIFELPYAIPPSVAPYLAGEFGIDRSELVGRRGRSRLSYESAQKWATMQRVSGCNVRFKCNGQEQLNYAANNTQLAQPLDVSRGLETEEKITLTAHSATARENHFWSWPHSSTGKPTGNIVLKMKKVGFAIELGDDTTYLSEHGMIVSSAPSRVVVHGGLLKRYVPMFAQVSKTDFRLALVEAAHAVGPSSTPVDPPLVPIAPPQAD